MESSLFTTEEIQDVLQATHELQLQDTSTSNLIRLRNIAITYRDCEHVPEAIEKFNDILAIDAQYLKARAGLAQCYA